ncbi:MAG TPA: Gfo/Idh/MocA family oxidoreductase [Tepidisphaeraceae bacterium]|nr:Gfo/Idh/MocA family oxidoreductase [Tepidisphaeraceae bacterium]
MTTQTAGAAEAAPANKTPATSEPVKKLNIAIVGCGGRGWDHVREVSAIANANIVALVDVDVNNLVNAARHVPKAAVFVDFRDMLDKQKDVDAMLVATPDHTHAVITAAALKGGKHVYCEKPLTHTLSDARTITELAQKTGKVTQMGIQIHAMDNYRRVVELVKSGAIGKVEEVHVWNGRTNRPANPTETKPPATLNYDLWLGPVSERPFRPDYHPFNWRRWWAFGTGLAGDIGCHLMDVAFWALDLKYPTHIESQGAPLDENITAEWTIAKFDYPARGDQPAVKLTWYDPPKRPPMIAEWKLPDKFHGEGIMFIGEGGKMLFTNFGEHILLPEEQFKAFKPPAQTIPKSPGHQAEWINACLENNPSATSAPFSYGGPLTETAILGTIAFRAQKALDWDAANMKFTNAPEAEKLMGSEYRSGWSL